MCGIIGIQGTGQVAHELLYGLNLLQHRGQDAAGIVTFSKHFHIKKGTGLVSNVFNKSDIQELQGNVGIGHVRYATQGSLENINSQPFYFNFPFGIAMAHNGNLNNSDELLQHLQNEDGRIVESTNDLELILYTLANNLSHKKISQLEPHDYFTAIDKLHSQTTGAYATIALIANGGLLGFTDPHGIRPLLLGEKKSQGGIFHAFASESSVLECLDYKVIHEFSAAEAVFISPEGKVYYHTSSKNDNFCVFEYIYFAREDSIFKNKLVANVRKELGRNLATTLRARNIQPDIITDVPSSAWFAASALAASMQIPYEKVLIKNKYAGRSFIQPNATERLATVKLKLNPIRSLVEGKKIAVVDDSIVRGTTSKHIVELLRSAGALEIYFISAAPPLKYPCIYGIDMAMTSELVSSKMQESELADYLQANAVVFQPIDNFKKIFGNTGLCKACFSGEYPTNISAECLSAIAEKRQQLQKRSLA